jgi:hypothetical protein
VDPVICQHYVRIGIAPFGLLQLLTQSRESRRPMSEVSIGDIDARLRPLSRTQAMLLAREQQAPRRHVDADAITPEW